MSSQVSPKLGRLGWLRLIVVLIFVSLLGTSFAVFGPQFLNFTYKGITKAPSGLWEPKNPAIFVPLALAGILIGLYLGNLAVNIWFSLTARWEKMETGDKVTLFLGIFGGIIVSLPFLFLFNVLPVPSIYLPLLIIGLTLGFTSLTVYALQSMAEILPWQRNRTSTKRSGIKILDTNVIIDGRIYDVAKTGFLEGEIYVPKFVLEELQHIADHHDGLRRQRGRRGLEVLRHMQAEFPMEVGKYDRFATDTAEPVDSRLVRIAKAIGADIVTNDSNLNSVARLQNVKIMSLNELALTLRPNVLPQETLMITIIREGNQHGQGIGYLDDGTMVVVENGRPHIGETLEVVVTQVIQTERGKMIFADAEPYDEEGEPLTSRTRRRR